MKSPTALYKTAAWPSSQALILLDQHSPDFHTQVAPKEEFAQITADLYLSSLIQYALGGGL